MIQTSRNYIFRITISRYGFECVTRTNDHRRVVCRISPLFESIFLGNGQHFIPFQPMLFTDGKKNVSSTGKYTLIRTVIR